jgi:XTP/dITP diphosphohydrolase
MTKIVLASRNKKKIHELKNLLTEALGNDIDVLSLDDIGFYGEIEENGTTFEENALIKARAGFAQTGMPTLADDSGLCIAAMGGDPGIKSARFASENGGYPAVFDVVQRCIGSNPDRSAYFCCCLALVVDEGKEYLFTGRVNGTIGLEPTGTHLFGYDPIFIPEGYTESFGVLDETVKNTISHRARAMKQLVDFLKEKSE